MPPHPLPHQTPTSTADPSDGTSTTTINRVVFKRRLRRKTITHRLLTRRIRNRAEITLPLRTVPVIRMDHHPPIPHSTHHHRSTERLAIHHRRIRQMDMDTRNNREDTIPPWVLVLVVMDNRIIIPREEVMEGIRSSRREVASVVVMEGIPREEVASVVVVMDNRP